MTFSRKTPYQVMPTQINYAKAKMTIGHKQDLPLRSAYDFLPENIKVNVYVLPKICRNAARIRVNGYSAMLYHDYDVISLSSLSLINTNTIFFTQNNTEMLLNNKHAFKIDQEILFQKNFRVNEDDLTISSEIAILKDLGGLYSPENFLYTTQMLFKAYLISNKIELYTQASPAPHDTSLHGDIVSGNITLDVLFHGHAYVYKTMGCQVLSSHQLTLIFSPLHP